MKIRRILSAFLAVIVLFAALSGCQNPGDPDTGSSSPSLPTETVTDSVPEAETEEKSVWDSLSPVDYGGYTFNILSFDSSFLTDWIVAEEMTGELLNDSVRERNLAVESLYNIGIELETFDYDTAFNSMINEVTAGTGAYDIAFQWAMKLPGAAAQRALYNLYDILEIHTDASWWNGDSVEALTLLPGKLYYAANAINCSNAYDCAGLFFNSRLVDAYSLDSPYELVKSGDWTLSRMYGMMETVMSNMDGTEKRTAEDMYGITSAWGAVMIFYHGCGVKLGEIRYEEDAPSMEITFAGEKELKAADWIYRVLTDSSMTADMNKDPWSVEAFYNGHSLFYSVGLYNMSLLRENMEDDFGVIPSPKLDETQERYYVCSGGRNSPLMCIPADQTDAARTGNIVEALSIYSAENLVEPYIEVLLSEKYARDEDTRNMIRLLIDNITWDAGFLTVQLFFDTWYPAVEKGGDETLTSTAQKIKNKVDKEFAKYIEGISG